METARRVTVQNDPEGFEPVAQIITAWMLTVYVMVFIGGIKLPNPAPMGTIATVTYKQFLWPVSLGQERCFVQSGSTLTVVDQDKRMGKANVRNQRPQDAAPLAVGECGEGGKRLFLTNDPALVNYSY